MLVRYLGAPLAGAVLTLAAAATAQKVPVLQVGAGGRYETQIDLKTVLPGVPPARVATFRQHIDRLIALFGSLPQVTRPPEPLCNRLGSWLELVRPHGVLAAEVWVMQPILFERGRCHNMSGAGVTVRINALSLLLDPQQAHLPVENGVGPWWGLPVEIASRRVIDLGGRVAFTHGRAPLLLPVSAERYLREQIRRLPADPTGGPAGELAAWLNGGRAERIAENERNLRDMAPHLPPAQIAQIAAMGRRLVDETEQMLREAAAQSRGPSVREQAEAALAALLPAERTAPACLSRDTGRFDPALGCPRGFTIVELNPIYFDRSRPDAVQLLVIETPADRTHGESDAKLAMRRAIWDALDRNALAAMVE